MSSRPRSHEGAALLSLRAAVVFTLALMFGVAAGALLYLADNRISLAVLAGGGTMAAAARFFNSIIARPSAE